MFVIHCLRLPPTKAWSVELAWATWLLNPPCCPAGTGMVSGRSHALVKSIVFV